MCIYFISSLVCEVSEIGEAIHPRLIPRRYRMCETSGLPAGAAARRHGTAKSSAISSAENAEDRRPFQGRHKGYPETAQGPHSEKSIWIRALYGSDRGLPEQLWRRKFLLRVHPGSNIIILSTPHEQVAGRLREINQLKIRGRIHPFNAYVADPEDVLRGIVHGLPPGTTQADLMANLRIRTQGVKIERARMLGSSKSAIITFTGDVLPRCVYFMGAEAICYPYKPTVQVCKICRSTGHRTDVCPTPNANVCYKCGTCDPTQEHECALNCAICGEEHATGDKSCKKKLKNVAPRKSRVETPRRQTECTYAEKDFPSFEQHQQKPRRWFSSDREEATLQTRQASRSSSRSRSRSRSSSKTPQQRNISKPAEAPGKPNLKKTPSSSLETSSAHARKEEAVAATTGLSTQDVQNNQPNKVSWASPVPPNVPATDSPQYRKILEENKRLTQEIKQLKNQMTAERKSIKWPSRQWKSN
ncbi:hypothetical protein HPB51_027627 [Rhipicephalus microplus]|uniref:Uncharacterized protein n=1 Tax=Rhipicephalus microplus TaxID=6941 RepID=A0A9J6CZG4_RHIMP|nr:hypothetical protein HPB51_027627 [Rhipicephalus microplus]